MAELVRDNPLKLGAIEPFDRSAGHRHDGIPRRMPRGERVDARLLLEYEHDGDRNPRGDRHLLDDVQELAFARVGGVTDDLFTPERQGDSLASTAQFESLDEAAHTDDHADGPNHSHHQDWIEERR